MKKAILSIVLLSLIGVGSFYFYSSNTEKNTENAGIKKSNLREGTYKAEFDKPDFRGWKAFFEMTVDQAGEITYVKYDYVNNNGQLKTQDESYNRSMMNKNGIGPKNYCPRFEKNLLIYQQPDKVDGITGATHSYDYFKAFAEAAFKAAATGNTDKIFLPQPELVNPATLQTTNNQ